ncbi:MAG: shikimate dehydrogenase, partial [Chloroflexi bacterium]|nr:shikimate dehydrogenase [Chloroflexota bacterium]
MAVQKVIRVGLLGWPVSHSVSPAMHNAAFQATSIAGRYDLLPVEPDRLGVEVARFLADGFSGFNVTIPHKQTVLDLPQIGEVSPEAEVIGAANTLVLNPDGRLDAFNTDWQGIRDDLLAHGVNVAVGTVIV